LSNRFESQEAKMAIFFPQNSFLAARAIHDGLAVLVAAPPRERPGRLVRQWDRAADGRLASGWYPAETGPVGCHPSVAGRG
jgi:hypothetical protein